MISWFFALPKIIKRISSGAVVLIILSLYLNHQCKEVRDAKQKKEKQEKVHEKRQKVTKEKVNVYNENEKEKKAVIEEVKDKFDETAEPPTAEELKKVRKKVGDDFKYGLPQ